MAGCISRRAQVPGITPTAAARARKSIRRWGDGVCVASRVVVGVESRHDGVRRANRFVESVREVGRCGAGKETEIGLESDVRMRPYMARWGWAEEAGWCNSSASSRGGDQDDECQEEWVR